MIRVPWAMPLGVAYRDWLLRLARMEADSGCPRLLGSKSEAAMYFGDVTAGWDADRRCHLMCARIKHLCADNYRYPPVPSSPEEILAHASWDYPFQGRDYGLGSYRSPGRPGAEFTWLGGKKSVVDADKVAFIRRWIEMECGAYKIDKSLLRRNLKEALRPSFGPPLISGSEWRFVTDLGRGIAVVIDLDLGGRRPSQLRYSQSICYVNDNQRVRILSHGGLDTLLGNSQTEWCYLTNDGIPAAARLLVQLCEEFVEAVPGMWERAELQGAGA